VLYFHLTRRSDDATILNSNIVTYHAEDGSGVGSAIIAGHWRLAFHSLTSAKFVCSHDSSTKGCWSVPSRLSIAVNLKGLYYARRLEFGKTPVYIVEGRATVQLERF
jgi:hypothetical protein